MKSNTRTVKFFDCKIRASSKDRDQGWIDVPPRTMLEVLDFVKNYLLTSPCHRRTRDKSETWHVADIDFDARRMKAIVLINRSDRLGADQAISNPEVNAFQVSAKADEEGNAYSAHIAINLQPVRANTYVCAIEDSNGISTKDIAALLTLIAREAGRLKDDFFYCNDASGDPALRRFSKYGFTFTGHPSPDFIAELNAGSLQEIELSDMSERDLAFDDASMTIEKRKIILLKPRDKANPVWDTIKSVGKTADARKLQTMRVFFKDDNSFIRSVDLDSRTLQLVNEIKFVRKERISGFIDRLDTGFETINLEIKAKMFSLI